MAGRPKITKLGGGKYNIDWSKVSLGGDCEDDFFKYENEPSKPKCDCGATKVVGYGGFKREHAHWCGIIDDMVE